MSRQSFALNFFKSIFFGAFLFANLSEVLADSESIQDRILVSLADEGQLGGHDFDINVRRGVVTLTGWVSSEADAETAERIVRKSPGVKDVKNFLSVEDFARNHVKDQAEGIRARYQAEPQLGNIDIELKVRNGEASVVGDVGHENDKAILGKLAKEEPGVTEVRTNLLVRPGPSDAEIAASLKEALDDKINMSAVFFSVSNGLVHFRGALRNHRELDEMLSIALMVPGVRDIKSNVKIVSKN